MTKDVIKEVKARAVEAIAIMERELNDERRQQAALLPLLPQMSNDVGISWGAGKTWISVNNREDLQVLLTLAPRWTKEVEGEAILYYNDRHPYAYFRIRATNEALPPTCRVVSEKFVEPAREAREYTITTVKCDL